MITEALAAMIKNPFFLNIIEKDAAKTIANIKGFPLSSEEILSIMSMLNKVFAEHGKAQDAKDAQAPVADTVDPLEPPI